MKNMKLGEMGLMMKMGFTMNRFAMTTVALGVMQVASAQVGITQVVPMQLADQGTELRVVFDGLPVQPKAYQLDAPSRLVLDFDGAANKLAGSNVAVNTAEVASVDAQADNERSRLTVNLKQGAAFTTRTEGNTFILKVANSNGAAATNVISQPVATKQANGLSNIGFERGAQGEGLVGIQLLSATTPVDVQQQGSKVVVRLLGSKVPTHLARRLNVNDFGTAVATIDAYNEGSNGVIVIQPSGSYEYMAYQAEDKLTISVKRPVENAALKTRAAQTYTGKKISLDFQDIEVRRVLQLLADFTDVNLVAADSVQGQITVRLKDVPWDQALDIILKSKNLDKRRNGNVIWIAPVTELLKAEKDESDAIVQSIKLAPIQTDYIQLNYAKVADIQKLITERKNASSSGSSGGNNGSNNDELAGSLLSPRGSVSMDVRTNTLIVNDTAQKIDEIRKMIELVDVPVKQVMIEARIVRATNSFSKDFGVKWGVLSQGITNNNNLLVGGSDTTLWNLRKPEKDNNTGGWKYTIDRPDNLNVDLGVNKEGAGRIAFGLINMSDVMLDLELSAAQADGKTEIVSTPKVMTMDKQKALIESGEEFSYTKSTTTNGVTTQSEEWKKAVLALEVTPSITPDGKVSMELNINKDSRNILSGVDTNKIQTQVLVNNGETVVLGGVFESVDGHNIKKIPFLGDLPLIGGLFKNTSKLDSKNELLIFVTPRIVNDTGTANR